MITATLKELIEGKAAMEQFLSVGLKAKTSYKVSKMLRLLNKHFEDFDQARLAARDRYGELVQGEMVWNGETDEEKEAGRAAFQAEMDELFAEVVNIEVSPIKLSELGDVEIPGSIPYLLYFMFEEDVND